MDGPPKRRSNPNCVALIPARAGSKRVPGKNVRTLAGHPLIAYTIDAALRSETFDAVIVSTESPDIAEVSVAYGAEVPFLRPENLAQDLSPDIEWVRHALTTLQAAGREWDCFSILRPTSPFRQPRTIQRAWAQFVEDGQADSLRALQLVREHPAKQWIVTGTRMAPVMVNPDRTATPWHSSPYQALPRVYVQNASLEIARTRLPIEGGTIAGESIMPFLTEGIEGFDINTSDDWTTAERAIAADPFLIPQLSARR